MTSHLAKTVFRIKNLNFKKYTYKTKRKFTFLCATTQGKC